MYFPNYGMLDLIFRFAMAALVYRDARMNGRSGVGWGVFVFFTSFIGLIIYIIVSQDVLKLAAKRARGKSLKERITSPTYNRTRNVTRDLRKRALPPEIDIETRESGFVDDDLEALIGSGKIDDAKYYLDNVLRIAREFSDEKTIGNYERYVTKLKRIEESGGDELIDV